MILHRFSLLSSALVMAITVCGGCGGTFDPAASTDAWFDRAKTIASEYTQYGRVDDVARWAPERPGTPPPPLVRMSDAGRKSPHAGMLYSIFARNHASYPKGPHLQQMVVQETWRAELVKDPSARYDPDSVARGTASTEGKDFYPYALDANGRLYRATRRGDLFIMFSVPKGTKNAEEGWVFATAASDGQVTDVGRINSCIECHRDTPNGGLFGLPDSGPWAGR